MAWPRWRRARRQRSTEPMAEQPGEPQPRARPGWSAILAVAPALVLAGVALNYYGDFVSDDAFISFRYAEHLGSGRGLEWNPGYRVEGYSNFLWIVLLAIPRALGAAVPEAARILAMAAVLATVALVALVVRRSGGQRAVHPVLLALSPLPLCLSFPFQYWCAMRLETALFSFLLLLAPALFLWEETRGGAGPRWTSALAYLALALVRPEGAVYAVIPLGHLAARAAGGEGLRAVARERAVWLGIIAGGVLLFLLFRWAYFGALLPNTFHAKVQGDGVAGGWRYLTRFCAERPYHLVLLLAPLLMGGLRGPAGTMLLGTALMSGLIAVLVGGDWMREFRLLVPATPLLAAALGVALHRALQGRGPAGRAAVMAGAALLVAGVQLNMGTPGHEWAAALRGERRDLLINLEGEMTRAAKEAGLWLRQNAAPGDLVAVNHAGALPFYSGLPTLDMVGLNDRHIARLPGSRHGKYDPAYVLSRKPRFVALNTRTRPVEGRYVPGYWAGETALFAHPEFQRLYAPIGRHWTWRHRSVKRRNHPRSHTVYLMIFQRRAQESSGPGLRAPSLRGKANQDGVSNLDGDEIKRR